MKDGVMPWRRSKRGRPLGARLGQPAADPRYVPSRGPEPYTYQVTLTIAFAVDEPLDEGNVKEYALEWIGSMSDQMLWDAMEVQSPTNL